MSVHTVKTKARKQVEAIDLRIIAWLRRTYVPVARIAIFVVYFYFGLLKIFDLSPASPLALALTDKTIGLHYFDTAFLLLAVMECFIGLLFLIPRATRIVIPLLLVHMVMVCSPLVLVPELAWSQFLVPSLEGQYIIKNIVIVALAVGIASHVKPLAMHSRQGVRS